MITRLSIGISNKLTITAIKTKISRRFWTEFACTDRIWRYWKRKNLNNICLFIAKMILHVQDLILRICTTRKLNEYNGTFYKPTRSCRPRQATDDWSEQGLQVLCLIHEAFCLRNEWYNKLLQQNLAALCDHENTFSTTFVIYQWWLSLS